MKIFCNMYQARNKKYKETNKFYWLTLAIVSILIIGINVYMVLRKKPSIETKAEPYLRPLPTGVDLNILNEISVLQQAIPLKPEEFYQFVKKYSGNINDSNNSKNSDVTVKQRQ